MRTTLPLLILAFPFFSNFAFGDQTVPTDHSSVHIVFVVPNAPANGFNRNVPQTRIGNLVVPVDSIRPISIQIDKEFVGHAMVGYSDIKPVFVLPIGTHEFQFACDGYKSSSVKLKVVGNGSTQYLIVRMAKQVADDGKDENAIPSQTSTPTKG